MLSWVHGAFLQRFEGTLCLGEFWCNSRVLCWIRTWIWGILERRVKTEEGRGDTLSIHLLDPVKLLELGDSKNRTDRLSSSPLNPSEAIFD